MPDKFILIGFAGALGALARYGLAGWVQRHFESSFPVGTAAVNILGSFLFGVVWSMAEERLVISGETRVIILTGFMGAFTTFSTFMFETGTLMRDTQWMLALANVSLQIAAGLICLFMGFTIGRLF